MSGYLSEQGLDQRFSEVRGTSTAPDGSVSIEVDVAGEIRGLRLADFAMDDGPDRLAEIITARHRSAMEKVAERVEAALQSNPPIRTSRTPSVTELDSGDEFVYVPSHLRRG